jgi:hypothetical protein
VLDLLALGRRLDDDRGVGHRRIVGDRGDAGKQRFGVGCRHLVLAHQPVQRLGDAALALFGHGDVDIGQEHVVAELGGRLGDARAHLPGTDHRYRWHASLLARFALRLDVRYRRHL